MATLSNNELRVFYSYSHRDQIYRQQLEKHLANLKRRYHLQTWFDRLIKPGDNWEGVLEEHLNSADLIFLLISADFMSSNYCYNKEMSRALERHDRGEAKVVPILVRVVDWKNAPFSHIQLLPTDARPIRNWPDSDKAYYDVVVGVEKVIQDLLTLRSRREEVPVDEKISGFRNYEEGLVPLERGKDSDVRTALDYIGEGMALRGLKRYEEALVAYEQAIQLDPTFANAFIGKGNVLNELKRYEEALAVYEQAILLDPLSTHAHRYKSITLQNIQRYQEDKETASQAEDIE